MAQIFPRWTNKLPTTIAIGTTILLGVLTFAIWYWFSPKYTDVGYQPKQPVPFSHQLHAGSLGMDCRYCHNTVERAPSAAIPPTATCMNCHSQLDLGEREARVKPIKDAWESGEPVEWVKVHMLPDYAYFNHSVHLAAGVGCTSCHGRIDQMAVVRQDKPLSMSWCLNCHRDPLPNLRPVDQITNMAWDLSDEAKTYDPLTDPLRGRLVAPPEHCSGCHR